MGFRIDFTDVPDSGSLPASDYVVKVTGGEQRLGKASNQPYINWEFTVQDGEFAGRHCWTNTTLQGDGLQYGLKPFLKALGFELAGDFDFKIDEDDEGDGPAMVGRELIVTLRGKKDDPSETEVKKFKAVDAAASILP